MVAMFMITPSIPTSPLGASRGAVCGPYSGLAKGHEHLPAHCLAALPTHPKGNCRSLVAATALVAK
ncbi:hypothetical protein Mapa_014209 [Marchantia paleacea]|nr:hypothetical protein Mapa_014209 [Marchantia paleacea]